MTRASVSVDMEYFAQFVGHRTIIRIGFHVFFHMCPPTLTNISLGNVGPALFILNLDVTDKVAEVRVES